MIVAVEGRSLVAWRMRLSMYFLTVLIRDMALYVHIECGMVFTNAQGGGQCIDDDLGWDEWAKIVIGGNIDKYDVSRLYSGVACAYYVVNITHIFGFIEQLNEVDTSSVEETNQETGLENVVRDDEVVQCDEETKKALIAAFPQRLGNLLKVKGVFK